MRKVKLTIYRNDVQKSIDVADQLRTKLKAAGFEFDAQNPDIVITVGGDGTLLGAFHFYVKQLKTIRFIGVHTGHLGFYTDWRDTEIDDLVEALKHDTGQNVSYPLLEVSVKFTRETVKKRFLSLNESTVKRLSGTLKSDVYIKDNLFESFRGDGLCVSTPTGSTAYSKSIGGAVIHPRLEVIQMAEIASINNLVYRSLGSPIIIAPDEWLTLKLADADDYVLTTDEFSKSERPIEEINYRIAKERIQFARYRHTHFWDRVKNSFIGPSHEI